MCYILQDKDGRDATAALDESPKKSAHHVTEKSDCVGHLLLLPTNHSSKAKQQQQQQQFTPSLQRKEASATFYLASGDMNARLTPTTHPTPHASPR